MGARPSLSILASEILARQQARGDEVDDVRLLLLAQADPAAGPFAECAAVADTVAIACLGDNHLWQALQLASRAELSAPMRRWFPALVAKSSADMKWKMFFYRQLCEREQILICKSPSCAMCCDQALCFWTQEG